VKATDAADCFCGEAQRTVFRREPGSLAFQKLRLPSLARGRLLRAFAGRVGKLGVLSKPD